MDMNKEKLLVYSLGWMEAEFDKLVAENPAKFKEVQKTFDIISKSVDELRREHQTLIRRLNNIHAALNS